jgi:hypothetical protein
MKNSRTNSLQAMRKKRNHPKRKRKPKARSISRKRDYSSSRPHARGRAQARHSQTPRWHRQLAAGSVRRRTASRHGRVDRLQDQHQNRGTCSSGSRRTTPRVSLPVVQKPRSLLHFYLVDDVLNSIVIIFKHSSIPLSPYAPYS